MYLYRTTKSRYARKVAISFILHGGISKVIEEECQVIWDSYSLVQDTTSNERVNP